MKPVIVRLSQLDHTEFKKTCASKGESMNDVIRQFIRDYIKKHNTKVA